MGLTTQTGYIKGSEAVCLQHISYPVEIASNAVLAFFGLHEDLHQKQGG